MTKVALTFPGQGSQAAGMAAGLEGPALEALLDAAAASGLDLRAALAGTDDELRPTEVAQPALVAVECALLAELPGDLEVVGVSGHSVGEYTALVAAGALTPEAAMALVVERGRAMASMRSGTMSALLGLDAAAAEELCAEVSQRGQGVVVVANLNGPGQNVVSGDVDAVAALEELARARGARRAVRLNVSGAFHSPLMAAAASSYAQRLAGAPLLDAAAPVVCNVDAAALTGADELREQLTRQLESPVRWTECVERLVQLGAELLVEVGPGSVLTGLARRIAPQVAAVAVNTPERARSLGSAEAVTR